MLCQNGNQLCFFLYYSVGNNHRQSPRFDRETPKDRLFQPGLSLPLSRITLWSRLATFRVNSSLPMSKRSVKTASALIWYIGAIALALKGGRLLAEADRLQPEKIWPWLAIAIGMSIGIMKARLFFIRACQKNLARIDAIENPRIWQCFRPRFFLFLFAMIVAGATLARLAHDNYPFLIGVAALDFSIAAALFSSSYIFWSHKASRI